LRLRDPDSRRAEADGDRDQQRKLLAALGAWDRALRRDELRRVGHRWRDWQHPHRGRSRSWVVFVACRSPQHLTGTKKKLSFCQVTQGERAQGYLKLPNGRTLTGHSHDYKRNGTTTLFAAFEVATGKVKAAHKKRRRRKEFLAFMDDVVAEYPNQRLEVILDNLNTHKKNDAWLKRHPNVTFHYTPTRASWLNQVECWFSILQGQSLAGASFTSVEQLKEHIDDFIETYNKTAEPFIWTKSKVHQRRVKGRRLSDCDSGYSDRADRRVRIALLCCLIAGSASFESHVAFDFSDLVAHAEHVPPLSVRQR
jgi:transposase